MTIPILSCLKRKVIDHNTAIIKIRDNRDNKQHLFKNALTEPRSGDVSQILYVFRNDRIVDAVRSISVTDRTDCMHCVRLKQTSNKAALS